MNTPRLPQLGIAAYFSGCYREDWTREALQMGWDATPSNSGIASMMVRLYGRRSALLPWLGKNNDGDSC